jgi:hypothetical protein
MPEVPLDFPRQWVEFTDPADPKHLIKADLTWLTSRWTCIFGNGCQGIDASRPDAGCCVHGAHFSEKKDKKRVAKWVDKLTPETWQRHATGHKKGWTEEEDGGEKTRVVKGACIFHNDVDFPGGSGCALHHLAAAEGVSFIETKPDVCWQLPLRLEEHTDDHGYVTSTLREWKRRDWGPGGAEFHWWCTETDEAFVGAVPAYQYLRDEIIEMVGQWAYDEMVKLIERPKWTPLPHPAVKR